MTHTKPKADKARIKVMAINEKTDGKQAKFLEKFLNHEYKRSGELLTMSMTSSISPFGTKYLKLIPD